MKKIGLITAMGILLSACSGNTTMTTQTTATPGEVISTQEVVASPTPTPITGPISIKLASQNNSGQTGQVIFQEVGGQVKVSLVTTGGKFAAPQPAHIHVGSCPTPGAVKYPLTNVSNGVSDTVLDVDLNTLIQLGPLAINVHKSETESGVYTSCGNLTVDGSVVTPSPTTSSKAGDGTMGY